MSRTWKDRPYRITGIRAHKYWISPKGHAAFTRDCRKAVRAAASQALREGREPEPKHPAQYRYFD